MKIPFVLVLSGLAGGSTMMHMAVCPCSSRGTDVLGKDSLAVYQLLGPPDQEMASKDSKQGLWVFNSVATCRAGALAITFDSSGKVVDCFDPDHGEGARKFENFVLVETLPAASVSVDETARSVADAGNSPVQVRPIK